MHSYKENIIKYDAKLLTLNRQLKRIAYLRLFVFVVSSSILITLLSFNLITPFFIVFPILAIGFAMVIKHHNKVAYLLKHTTFLKNINQSEILRGNGDLAAFDTGSQFINQNHPYTSDLDIFGPHSIFQLVNRTTTESGGIRLSEWLSNPASNSEIHDRQKAIKELSQQLSWRQGFQAAGMHFQNKKSDYYKLLAWVEEPVALLKKQFIYKTLAIILPILFVLSFYFFMNNLIAPDGYIYLSLMILVLIINYYILKKISPLAEDIVETSTNNLNTLRGYSNLINQIENKNFTSNKLIKLQSILTEGQYSAYSEINSLCKILDFSHQRRVKKEPFGGNYFYSLLNGFLLLDIYLIIGTEKWKVKNKTFLKPWANVISEFEVINSLAGFSYANPSYCFPAITENNNYVHFIAVGHPLINHKKRVCNNFQSKGQGNIAMITGSNMGGKSTFLRTVGVNLVLSLAGAPCCAKDAQVPNVSLYTSMRTQDNLLKGISSFYAELNRIEAMLKLIESGQPTFFLLDEMFKGTNSEDRHKGGFSLINQLNTLNTSGIIATHDIELAKLSDTKQLVTNYSFNSEIKHDAMVFSYKLDASICNDFNASKLMEKSGIKMVTNTTSKPF